MSWWDQPKPTIIPDHCSAEPGCFGLMRDLLILLGASAVVMAVFLGALLAVVWVVLTVRW